jgi:DGQHR domain-containing protein
MARAPITLRPSAEAARHTFDSRSRKAGRSGRRASEISVRALHTRQGSKDVYSFFIPGGEISRIADIIRISRDERDALKGFQRKEIRNHIRDIVQYLNKMNVLFPNAITLAFAPEVRFTQSRGPLPRNVTAVAQAGILSIPVREEGERVGWVVDGQQRSLALAESKNRDLPVPVVAFVSNNLRLNREQFILMNKSRPLPGRLINELLPETDEVLLPKDLASRRIPSELCSYLARESQSPFHGLIRRPSDMRKGDAVVIDTAIVKMIRTSINSPLGALSPHKAAGNQRADVQAMFRMLCSYWGAVKAAFPDAWGLPPNQSRLMHSAGIQAMGVLMDKVFARHAGKRDEKQAIRTDLMKLAPRCAWTEGTWDILEVDWNEIENTSKDIRALSDTLVRLYATAVPR